MDDATFLNWLANRLVNHYGENEGTDFVRRTKQIADRLKVAENKPHIELVWDLNND